MPDIRPRLDLNLLMLFMEIIRCGSISQAAVHLRTPKATLSRKLRQLEKQIGAVLVRRSAKCLELTEIGEALLHRCERISVETHDAAMIAAEMQSQLSGVMRVSMPIGLASTWVSRAISDFALRYPEVRLIIHVSNRWIDVSEEPYDVAICIGRVRNEQLPARRLAELPRGLYASPDYCTRKGVPQTPAQLVDHDCIVLDSQVNDGVWAAATAGGRTALVPHLATTDIVVAKEMAVAGVGIAMLTHPICEEEVRSGQLVRILPNCRIPPVIISATFLERRYMPQRIRAFIDLIAQAVYPGAEESSSATPGIVAIAPGPGHGRGRRR
ncbi:MAG TPA: LysR family transcriptional regulator [Steroidobacteraceae bacterium]|nr:LysR family transcriptional regulator [Steroidobacteraceae bacterium]